MGKYITLNHLDQTVWSLLQKIDAKTTETDPVFAASAASGITNTDITNWNNKISDTGKWAGVELGSSVSNVSADSYVPTKSSTANGSGTANWSTVTNTPANYTIPKYDGNAYLHSTTPTSGDNTTKVATTAFVDSAISSLTAADTALRERYGVCSTAGDTAAKTVVIDSVTSLYEGLYIFVKFANANTIASPTLQVNSLDAKPIKRYGTTNPSTSADSSWNAGSVQILVYDGTYWQMTDWLNTTYSAMSSAEITAGTSTSSRLITPARLKEGVQTWAPVQSVNGDTGSVVVDKIKTTAGVDNTEYNLIGTASTNTNNAAEEVYNPTLISFSKYDNNFARLTLGSTATPGELRLYTSASGASGYTDLKSAASSTNTRTITLPDATGTVALTSDIPDVKSWALAANKPSYTFSELTTTPTSLGGYGITDAYTKTEVDGMVSGVLHYKGTKATVSALPSSGNTTGDVWHITADGSEYAWDGTTWQELGTATDLSGYVPTSRTINGKALTSNISLTASDVSALPSSTTYVSSFNGESGAITYTAPVTSVNGQTGAVTIAADDKTWNGVSLVKTIYANNTNYYLPFLTSSSATQASLVSASAFPTAKTIAVFDENAYLKSTTPSANDNSTKVATTAYVDAAIPSVPSWALASSKPTYTASEVGAVPSSKSGSTFYSTISNNGSSISLISSDDTFGYSQLSMSGGATTLSADSITLKTNNINNVVLSGGNTTIIGVVTPTTNDMAANKAYVDNKVSAITASDVGALPSTTTYVSSFNGSTGAITYTAPVTSVNGFTGAVTISIPQPYNATTNPTGYLRITDLPIYDGTVV